MIAVLLTWELIKKKTTVSMIIDNDRTTRPSMETRALEISSYSFGSDREFRDDRDFIFASKQIVSHQMSFVEQSL
jgi:hypothetical protein